MPRPMSDAAKAQVFNDMALNIAKAAEVVIEASRITPTPRFVVVAWIPGHADEENAIAVAVSEEAVAESCEALLTAETIAERLKRKVGAI